MPIYNLQYILGAKKCKKAGACVTLNMIHSPCLISLIRISQPSGYDAP